MPGMEFARHLANNPFGRFVRMIRPKAVKGRNDLDQCCAVPKSDGCGEYVADSVILA
jgi:hypothetical protein